MALSLADGPSALTALFYQGFLSAEDSLKKGPLDYALREAELFA